MPRTRAHHQAYDGTVESGFDGLGKLATSTGDSPATADPSHDNESARKLHQRAERAIKEYEKGRRESKE